MTMQFSEVKNVGIGMADSQSKTVIQIRPEGGINFSFPETAKGEKITFIEILHQDTFQANTVKLRYAGEEQQITRYVGTINIDGQEFRQQKSYVVRPNGQEKPSLAMVLVERAASHPGW